MRDPYTLKLCQDAVAATSRAVVAREIEKSRTAISLYLSDKYGADTSRLESAIRTRYDRYPCPHTGEEISGPDCHRRATAPRPFGGRAKEANWLACQGCQHNQQGDKQ